LLDFVVAEIERQSEIDPSNPDLQNKLGESYLQQTFAAGVGPASMEWGEKADAAFDRALEVDEEHWEARFNKAVSLSNWPVFLGKSGEAIRQFEILVDQQERKDTPRGGFDRTYYFLGNMYQQIGKRDKAKATWARGAQLFPDSEPLQTQLANN
jgi:tetratricopeptide (TPR) repeat protein